MASAYGRIALTYVQRKLFWFPLGVAFLLLCTIGSLGNLRGRGLFWLIILGSFASSLVIHVKEQIASPRAKLTPGFRLPHLITAFMVSSSLIILASLQVWLDEDASLFAALGIFGVTFFGVAWLQFRNSVLLWLGVPMLLYIVFGGFVEPLLSLFAGDMPGIAAGMLATSIMALLALAVRFMKLNEEMPEYHNAVPMNPWNLRQRRRDSGPEWLSSLLTGSSRSGPLNRRWGTSLWARARLWRMGMGTMSPVIQALLLTMFILSLGLIFSRPVPGIPNTPAENVLAGMIVWCGFFFPLITCISAARGWMMRLSRLGYESLRPADRRQFIREIGLAFTIDMWSPWIVFMFAIGLAIAIIKPEALTGPDVLYVFLTSLSFLLIAYAATAFLSIHRSIALTTFAIACAFAVVLFFALSRGAARDSSGVLWYFALVAIGSVALTVVAYRQWCNVDLE